MLEFIFYYFLFGLIHQLIEYIFYWSNENWSYERQFLRDLNSNSGHQLSGAVLEKILHRHTFEIRKMLFYGVIHWPFTIGRYFIKTGSDLDLVTRTRMLHALLRTIS